MANDQLFAAESGGSLEHTTERGKTNDDVASSDKKDLSKAEMIELINV
jgi:hypothetical protein